MSETFERLKTALADRYEILRELGAGGMATVYLARDAKHNRNVAIKVLRPELAAVLGGDRFLKEIEVTANLQHPHICALQDLRNRRPLSSHHMDTPGRGRGTGLPGDVAQRAPLWRCRRRTG